MESTVIPQRLRRILSRYVFRRSPLSRRAFFHSRRVSRRFPLVSLSGSFLFLGLVLCAMGCATSATSSHNACVRGVDAFHQGDYAQASVNFSRALSEDPKNADALYNMGAVYHRLWIAERNPGDAAQAEQYYRNALEINPDMTEAYRGIAVLLTTQGRQQEAVQTLYTWARRDQTTAAPRLELARLSEEINAPDAAAKYLEEAKSIEPQNPRVLAAIGRLREKAGEPNAAAMFYERAAQNSDSPELKAYLASLKRSQNGDPGLPQNVSLASGTRTSDGNEPRSGTFLERLSQLFSPSQEPSYRLPTVDTQTYIDPTYGGAYPTTTWPTDVSGFYGDGTGGGTTYMDGDTVPISGAASGMTVGSPTTQIAPGPEQVYSGYPGS
ncbi:MAG: tetratricopeptide repeat protein [Planctomycetia bacterium]|nr:tetratricopeptide repeat protein [Planctomycetia bacterium]